ncbi:type II secretion system secretin GspD [Breoghania corrubedonensis]|uniref:type II secretion system secretin GspD n=1 Tax=Breoghania corrubedonensis TaxID=665038 RepID=UPI0014727CD6|nr:type II secretion system secretin GspD [Breoghania corrubedonensis]
MRPAMIAVLLLQVGCSGVQGPDAIVGEPWLASYRDDVRGKGIDTANVNLPSSGKVPVGVVAVIDNEPTNISLPGEEIQRNAGELASAGASKYDLSEQVEISFDNDPLDYVVKQLLGGLLAANYVTADKLEGRVSFKTEQPVPRAVIPSILRDILARHGYVMKLINGVYQIGSGETIAVLENNAVAGASGEYVNQIVNLKRGKAEDLAAVVASILPRGATVTPVASTNSLVLRLSPVDVKPVTELIRALVDSGAASSLVAVIPVRESSPEKVAGAINAYYSSQDIAAAEVPLIIPLEDQQALLVGAKTQRILRNARTLISGLDKDNRDAPSLRVIPLQHLPPADIANQLNAIFGGEGAGAGNRPADTSRTARADNRDETTTDANSGGDSVPTPSIIRSSTGRGQASPTAASFEQGRNDGSFAPKVDATIPQTDTGISIVPDTRNNALLVYATFRQFKRIRDVVRALDLPLAQVVIEATIVEVDLTDGLDYGVQAYLRGEGLDVRSSRSPFIADPGGAGGVASFDIDFGDYTASFVLHALQAVTNVKVISSPYLTVLDGRSARLSVGDQVPYLTKQTAATNTGTTTTTNEIEVRDVGIILQVTPSIRADNSVVLTIQQEVSSAKTAANGDELTPIIQQRTINSDIVVNSGKTVLLGGLIQDRDDKVTTGVPVLSSVPLMGNLFKQTNSKKSRTELVVMITPRVVRRPSQIQNITRLIKARLSTP